MKIIFVPILMLIIHLGLTFVRVTSTQLPGHSSKLWLYLGNGWGPSGNKPLPSSMLTTFLSPYGISHFRLKCELLVCEVCSFLQPCQTFNSLGPSNAIWWQRSGSTLAKVMACCLTAPSHYLNQCWLIISKVLGHSLEGIIMRRSEDNSQ